MLPDVWGFQLRNAVQILQGFPSGPNTIPGGSGAASVLFPWVFSSAMK